MRKTIVLTFTAAALLMAAAVAFNVYGCHIFESQWAAAEDLPHFVIYDRFGEQLRSWEKAALVCGWLSISLSTAGAMLWAAESRTGRQRVLLLGLCASAPRRIARAAAPVQSAVVVKAHAAVLPRADEDDGLTPLERVIRGS